MNMEFKNKNVIITGGCSGIGRAIAFELLRQGVKNIGLLNRTDTADTVNWLRNQFSDRSVDFYSTDVSDKAYVDKSFEQFIKKHNRIDIVVSGSAVLNEQDYKQMVNVNLIGAINTIYAAMEHMSIEKGGHGGLIVPISSICATGLLVASPSYAATKIAILHFIEVLSQKDYLLNKHGIKFITICPGHTSSTNIFKDFKENAYHELKEIALQINSKAKFQSAEICAVLSVELMSYADNGSIWIIKDGERIKYEKSH